MSKVFISLVFFSISLWGVVFHSYEDALKLQKQNKKIIMIDAVSTNCHYCEDMNNNVLQDPKMSQWLEKRFITVKMNIHKETLPLGLKVNFTPTFFFIDSEQKLVKKIPGSWKIEDFKDLTKNIIKDK